MRALQTAPRASLAGAAPRPAAAPSLGRLGAATWRPLAPGMACHAEGSPRSRTAVEAGNAVPVGEYGERVVVAGLDCRGPRSWASGWSATRAGAWWSWGRMCPTWRRSRARDSSPATSQVCSTSPLPPLPSHFAVTPLSSAQDPVAWGRCTPSAELIITHWRRVPAALGPWPSPPHVASSCLTLCVCTCFPCVSPPLPSPRCRVLLQPQPSGQGVQSDGGHGLAPGV